MLKIFYKIKDMTEKRFQSEAFRETVIALSIFLGCIEVKAEDPHFFVSILYFLQDLQILK